MSLQDRLDRIREGAKDRIPADALEIMHECTEELRTSGILDGVVGAGDPAPDFALPDTDGDVHRLAELVADGPVVLSFFRGHW